VLGIPLFLLFLVPLGTLALYRLEDHIKVTSSFPFLPLGGVLIRTSSPFHKYVAAPSSQLSVDTEVAPFSLDLHWLPLPF